MKYLGGRLSDSGSRSGHICDGTNATRVIARGNGDERHGTRQPGRAAGSACGQAAVAGAIPVRSRRRLGLLPLSLLQRCRRGRPFGFMRRGLRCGLALAAMNGCLVLMADMGLGNRRRERKHDQDDRRSQNSHDLLLQHDGSIVAQVSLRYRRGTGNSRSSRAPEPSALFFQEGEQDANLGAIRRDNTNACPILEASCDDLMSADKL